MVLGTNGSLVGQITEISLEKRLGALGLTKTNKYLGDIDWIFALGSEE